MNRLKFASQLIKNTNNITSLLDAGCRNCDLKIWLPSEIQYYGSDLYQNKNNTVDYVGDITHLNVNQQFDLVVALDILEHVEQPSLLLDKLFSIATIGLIISLPNCYDLKGRLKFLLSGHLGGKYIFSSEIIEDRHRWLMSRHEIKQFYEDKAKIHNVSNYLIADMKYGDPDGSFPSKMRSITRLLPSNLCTETVFCVFIK